MAAPFDPYFKWLGIAPKDQPPTHYRLLGLDPFVDDPDVISNAADRQSLLIRTFQSGEHRQLSQRILNEIAAARVCLLNPERKAAYDAMLRAKTTAVRPPPRPANSPVPPSGMQVPMSPPIPTAAPVAAAPRIAPPPYAAPPVVVAPVAPVWPTGPTTPVKTTSPRKRKSRRFPVLLLFLALAASAATLLLVAGMHFLGGTAKKPVADKSRPVVRWKQNEPRFKWLFTDNGHTVSTATREMRPNSWLLSEETFRDFLLTGQIRVEEGGAGGIYVRVPTDAKWPWSQGFEVHFVEPGKPGTGAIFQRSPPKLNNVTRPVGEWNDVRIQCRNHELKVWINDRLVNEYDMPAGFPQEGRLGLDGVNGGVSYRNLKVEPL